MQEIQIEEIILSCLRETLSEINEENNPPQDSLNTSIHLIGRQAVLDSMGLVTAIVNIEQKLNEDYGLTITIADERALSQKNSPFRTVKSLCDYISLLIQEKND